MSLSSLNSSVEANNGCGPTCKKIMAEEIDDLKKPLFWRAVFAEFLGCTLLVFFGVGAGLHEEGKHGHSSVHIILAAGFFIAVIISSLANVSGAHVNPALSLAFAISRDISVVRFIFYTIAQSLGGIAGAGLVKVIFPSVMHGNLGLLQPSKHVSVEQALVAEVLITFFLIFVIFSLIDKGRQDVQGSIPFIVGLTVCVNIFFSGHLSGGCMNPIRNLGPAVVLGDFKLQWIYWVGPLLGGALGGLLYDKVFSVTAERYGLKSCMMSRAYQEVNRNDVSELNQEIQVRPGSSNSSELSKKPLESIERVASV